MTNGDHGLTRRLCRGAALALTVVGAAPRPAHAMVRQDTLTRISAAVDSLIQRQMERRQIPGAAVVVTLNGHVLKDTAYGVANLATGEKASPTTAFFVASITKAFTAATVLGLVQDGSIRLTDTIGAFVPGLPAKWRGADVFHLLAMTSGIPDSDRDPQRGIPWPDYQTALDSSKHKPMGERGERVYSGSDYMLLGKLVEAVTKQPFADVVRRRILEPLHLQSASFGDWREIRAGRAEWYSVFDPDKQDLSASRYVLRTDYPSYRLPTAGMFITARDLATFVDALDAGRVLAPAALATYWQPVILKDGSSSGALLGSWRVGDSTEVGRPVFHEGGARSAVLHDRRAKLTIVLLTNLQGGVPLQWIDRVRALYDPIVRRQ